MVYFTASIVEAEKDIKILRTVIGAIHKTGAILARDWIEPAYNRIIQGLERNDEMDWESIIDDNLEAMHRADLAIVEATRYRFSQGYFLSMALQYKKPTLVLINSSLKDKSLVGIASRLLTVKQYKTQEELSKYIEVFIKDNIISTKELRFNLFIDRSIHNYLQDKAYRTGKNKSEIIRDLLQREIDSK